MKKLPMIILAVFSVFLMGCIPTQTPTAHPATATASPQPSETATVTPTETILPGKIYCLLEVFYLGAYRQKLDFACPAQIIPPEANRDDGLTCYLEQYQGGVLFRKIEINCPARFPVTWTPEP